MQTEPQEVYEAKRRRYLPGYGHALTGRHMPREPYMRMWDPSETEFEFNGKTVSRYFRLPTAPWLNVESFFLSDTQPRDPGCHHYCEVDVGQTCHACKKKVRAFQSGVSCPCRHTWYCA